MEFDFKKGPVRFINGGKYPHCNTVFIDDEIRCIIDPACDESILKEIQHTRPVDVIINSHGHEDHFLYNRLFPDAALWVPEHDAPLYRSIDHIIDEWFDPDKGNKDKFAEKTRKYLVETFGFIEREPDRLLRDNDVVNFGNTRIRVLHTPGHSRGHLCFHFPDQQILFTADLDLVKAGPYYGDAHSDIDDMIHSLKRLMDMDVEIYLSAHGNPGIFDGDPIHIQNYLNIIYQREEKLLDLLKKGPKTLKEIADHGIIYKNKGPIKGWNLSVSEKIMMKKHLQRLERQKMVYLKKDHYTLIEKS